MRLRCGQDFAPRVFVVVLGKPEGRANEERKRPASGYPGKEYEKGTRITADSETLWDIVGQSREQRRRLPFWHARMGLAGALGAGRQASGPRPWRRGFSACFRTAARTRTGWCVGFQVT